MAPFTTRRQPAITNLRRVSQRLSPPEQSIIQRIFKCLWQLVQNALNELVPFGATEASLTCLFASETIDIRLIGPIPGLKLACVPCDAAGAVASMSGSRGVGDCLEWTLYGQRSTFDTPHERRAHGPEFGPRTPRDLIPPLRPMTACRVRSW